MPERLNLQTAAISDTGKVRDHNEDAFGHCLEAGVFVVCDGMGGAAAGEVASRLAVDTIMEHLCAVSSPADRRRALEEAIAAANRLVHGKAAANPAFQGMGTTLVAVAIQDHSAIIGHVGDSRCYLFRRGELIRKTEDHSLVDEQVRLGHLTPEEAARSPLKNVITRAIGTQPEVTPDISELPLEPGDTLLLCSDGLVREVSDTQIEDILNRRPGFIDDFCQQLIDAANNSGSHDNVTVLLIRAN